MFSQLCTYNYIDSMLILYLDNCCFNRPYDDQAQLRIRLETEAKLYVQQEILTGKYKLAWSYILDYENSKNPFLERKLQIEKWRKQAIQDVEENEELLLLAKELVGKGFGKMDALHIACAVLAKADFFLTTDDGILKKGHHMDTIRICNPIDFIKEAG